MEQFKDAVLTALAELRTNQQTVIARLDKINGSVGRHEDQIQKLHVEEAKRTERESVNGKWVKMSWGIVGSALTIITTHLSTILQVLPKK